MFKYYPINVEAVYTGGGIWLFCGEVSDGNWFFTDDFGCTLILDTNPDTDWDNCCYDTWQKAHLVKELKGKERIDFANKLINMLYKTNCDMTNVEIERYKKEWNSYLV